MCGYGQKDEKTKMPVSHFATSVENRCEHIVSHVSRVRLQVFFSDDIIELNVMKLRYFMVLSSGKLARAIGRMRLLLLLRPCE